jgi:hypothetical protein
LVMPVSRRGSTCYLHVRAALLIVWLQLDVSGFRLVLARGWHAAGCLGSTLVKMTAGVTAAGTRARYPV